MIRTTTRALFVCGLSALALSCATGSDPCDPNPCVAPPADNCVAGVAWIYPATGQCFAPGTQAECTYEPALVDCAETGQFCHEGVCLADPCDPNPCVSAPADGCDGNVAVTYDETGSCEITEGNVECTYAEASRTDCALAGEICENGVCVVSVEPCNPNPCAPPGPSCNGNVAETFSGLGTCTDVGGSANCSHTPATQVDCTLTGEVCSGGACVLGGGAVFISEYVEGSSFNKYLELYNASASAVDLSTYTVEIYSNGDTSVSTTLTLASVVLQPGEVFVIADDGHTLWTSPGPDQVFTSSFWNGNDAIRLVDGTTQVDLMGTIGNADDWGDDRTFVRNAGVNVGITSGTTWDDAEWTELAIDAHQLGGHTP